MTVTGACLFAFVGLWMHNNNAALAELERRRSPLKALTGSPVVWVRARWFAAGKESLTVTMVHELYLIRLHRDFLLANAQEAAGT
jgi:hypothetical protein